MSLTRFKGLEQLFLQPLIFQGAKKFHKGPIWMSGPKHWRD